MGMFDYVHFEMVCPKCAEMVRGFQSKDAGCNLDTIEPDGLQNFYTSCDACGAWIEFYRERHQPPARAGSGRNGRNAPSLG